MTLRRLPLALAALLALTGPAIAQDAPQPLRQVVLATGTVDGLYWRVGGALQGLLNGDRKEPTLRLSVETSDGSVQNVQLLTNGRVDAALVQSDVQHQAVLGEGEAFPQPASALRALFSLHAEPFTIVARSDAGIQTVADLAGKSVAVGGTGSGYRLTLRALMGELGWTADSFARLDASSASDAAAALCARRIDAFVMTAGIPAPAVTQATQACDAVLVPARDGKIDLLLERRPDYAVLTVPAGSYPGQSGDIATFGVRATLVASTAMSDDDAYEIVRTVFDNLDSLRKSAPALAGLEAKAMAGEGLTAPLHEGALRYFREKNLLPKPAPAAEAPAPARN